MRRDNNKAIAMELSVFVQQQNLDAVRKKINQDNVSTLWYNTSLLQSVISCDTQQRNEKAYLLIDLGVNVNHQNDKGATALHDCAASACIDIAKYILKHGGEASLSLSDQYGNQPLWTATYNATLQGASESENSLMRLFCEHGADVHHQNHARKSPMDLAIEVNDQGLIDILNENNEHGVS